METLFIGKYVLYLQRFPMENIFNCLINYKDLVNYGEK